MIKYLLCPIAWLFTIAVHMRNKLYDWAVFPIMTSKVPIISVGNIQVGGTGKTPFVIALAKKLIENNIKPLIITRGYKRNTKHQIIFNSLTQYSVEDVGDEPYYMKYVLKSVPIIIDHNKKNAVKKANELSNIDCIILDDGFQSRYLKKNIEIVLTSFTQVNNFSLMPIGWFREPVSSLKRADFVYNTKNYNLEGSRLKEGFRLIKYKQGIIETSINIDTSKPVIIFSGIANPKYFKTILERMNIKIEKEINFENHAYYNEQKYQKLKKHNPNDLSFITTYKDFFKLNAEFKKNYTIYILEMYFIIDDIKLTNGIKLLVNEN